MGNKTSHEFRIECSEYEIYMLRKIMAKVKMEYAEDDYLSTIADRSLNKINNYILPNLKEEQVTALFFKSEIADFMRAVFAFSALFYNPKTDDFYSISELLNQTIEALDKCNNTMEEYSNLLSKHIELVDWINSLEEADCSIDGLIAETEIDEKENTEHKDVEN